jgi:hypothetical protein
MSLSYGVTPEGFVAKPLAVIKAEVETELKTGPLGQSAGTEPDGSIPPASLAGQLTAIIVDQAASQWDLQQEVYASFDPTSATDTSLDNVCAITGTERVRPAYSTVPALCCGVAGTVLQPSRAATVTTTGARFLSQGTAATLAAVSAWVGATLYAVDDLVKNGGKVYRCITAGTSAGSGGPTGTADDITDGTAHWIYGGTGAAAVVVDFQASDTGPVGATVGELATIATPVSGWQTVRNLVAATVGHARQIDQALRVQRDAELASSGNAAIDAIRAHVLDVGKNTNNPVEACRVFYNDSDVTGGLPWAGSTLYALGAQATNDSGKLYLCVVAGLSALSGGPTGTGVAITDGTVTAWLALTAYVAGNRVTLGGKVYECTVNGTSAGSGGPTGTGINITDGTVHWRYVATATSGVTWQYVSNTPLPPHSVEVLVLRDSADPDPEIAAAVFASVGGGIRTVGSVVTVVFDDKGLPRQVRYSRPEEVLIYIVVAVTYDPATYPTADVLAGGQLLKDALFLFGSSYAPGYSVRADELDRRGIGGPATVGGSPVPGVLKVTSLFIGTAPSPVASADIPITQRQIAKFDTTRIAITLTPGSP